MPRPHLSFLGDKDVEFLHERLLAVLETVGARFVSAKARALMKQAGCIVDEKSHVVLIPHGLVEETMASLRRDVLLAARNPQEDALLDGSRTFLATAGICPYIADRQSGAPGEPTLADLAIRTSGLRRSGCSLDSKPQGSAVARLA